MSVKARVMAGHISRIAFGASRQVRTADLHLAPQLRLGFLALLLFARLWCACSGLGTALALDGDLAGMHVAVSLYARALAIVLGCVCHTGRR